jgi:uncharacterized Zn finger protein
MKCTACGYDDTEQKPVKTERICIDGTGQKKPFIELYGLSDVVKRGRLVIRNAIPLYACPNCGTVRMDTGC